MKHQLRLFAFFIGLTLCHFSSAQFMIPKFEEPQKIDELSTNDEEGFMVPFNDGQEMYFYRTYSKGDGSDAKSKGEAVWYSKKGKSGWKSPYRLFKADFIEGIHPRVIGTSLDGKRIYTFVTDYSDKNKYVDKLGYYDNEGKDKWSEFVEIKIPNLSFEEKWCDFHMNAEGNILLIAMSPSPQHLDQDLYVSIKDSNGKWGEAIDLGPTINTQKEEYSPVLLADNKTLYFATDGHGGLGELDIFVTYRLTDGWTKWSKPLNLGEPINSEGSDEFFVLANDNEIYFTSDRESGHHNIYYTKATGEFQFANLDSVGGEFFFKGLPRENISLEIFDAEDNLVAEVVTDAFGRFSFQKLDPDAVYVIKLTTDDNDDFVGSKIYFVNEDGKRTNRYILTEDGVFADSKDINQTEQIRGRFNYMDLPMKDAAMVLIDENGFPIDTIYTDENGNFSYNKLVYDDRYSIVPLNLDDDEWNNSDIYLTDLDGNRTHDFILRKDQFVFSEIKDSDKILAVGESIQEIKDNSDPLTKKREILSEGWNGKSGDFLRLKFDFARTDPNGIQKLDQVIEFLKNNVNATITVEGHTDSIGTMPNNMALGQKRADAVKAYLVKKGLEPNRINSVSKGESMPIATNMYKDGRAQNRRVEVILD
ncbi:MAG: hypothetical protein CMO34_03165 [Verrucomicrobia bacterium]|nr:hypothetical protein [Verrucomicrobiota bacterium]|tara:strand:- start:3124 stop:5061 length:1938 start_codon:yes stop_codon:yes gene_type:complete